MHILRTRRSELLSIWLKCNHTQNISLTSSPQSVEKTAWEPFQTPPSVNSPPRNFLPAGLTRAYCAVPMSSLLLFTLCAEAPWGGNAGFLCTGHFWLLEEFLIGGDAGKFQSVHTTMEQNGLKYGPCGIIYSLLDSRKKQT